MGKRFRLIKEHLRLAFDVPKVDGASKEEEV